MYALLRLIPVIPASDCFLATGDRQSSNEYVSVWAIIECLVATNHSAVIIGSGSKYFSSVALSKLYYTVHWVSEKLVMFNYSNSSIICATSINGNGYVPDPRGRPW